MPVRTVLERGPKGKMVIGEGGGHEGGEPVGREPANDSPLIGPSWKIALAVLSARTLPPGRKGSRRPGPGTGCHPCGLVASAMSMHGAALKAIARSQSPF